MSGVFKCKAWNERVDDVTGPLRLKKWKIVVKIKMMQKMIKIIETSTLTLVMVTTFVETEVVAKFLYSI